MKVAIYRYEFEWNSGRHTIGELIQEVEADYDNEMNIVLKEPLIVPGRQWVLMSIDNSFLPIPLYYQFNCRITNRITRINEIQNTLLY